MEIVFEFMASLFSSAFLYSQWVSNGAQNIKNHDGGQIILILLEW